MYSNYLGEKGVFEHPYPLSKIANEGMIIFQKKAIRPGNDGLYNKQKTLPCHYGRGKPLIMPWLKT